MINAHWNFGGVWEKGLEFTGKINPTKLICSSLGAFGVVLKSELEFYLGSLW